MKAFRALRRRILTPDVSATRVDVRGFHVKNGDAVRLLETVGSTFLTGFGEAAQARAAADVVPALEQVPTRFRGFAYEGAAMALAVRDAIRPGPVRHVRAFLDGVGDPHVYMAYVGIGWAMARLPRFLWPRLSVPDPMLRWLALDGYGFHQAYFRTERYVYGQYREDSFRWPAEGPGWYAPHAIDQGVGRAMWFVAGTDPEVVCRMIEKFPEHRRADLYSGTGLAATYAGGVDEAELRALRERAGRWRPHLAQGAAFAAGARVRADLVVPHNELATQVLCDMSTAEAAKVTDEALVDLPTPRGAAFGDPPAYESWRRRITECFV